MKVFGSLMLSIALFGCGSGDRPVSEKAGAIPPPPPPPMPSRELAYQAAVAAGPGTCRDLQAIRVLPFRGDLGWDKAYDRIAVHIAAYRPCLIEAIADTTPIPDPGEALTRHPFALGDLAFDVLTSTGQIDFNTCIPKQIQDRVDVAGVSAFQSWLHAEGNRVTFQHCVEAKTTPNNSFKPKPLRGSASKT